MPYITQNKRNELDPVIEELRKRLVSLALDDEKNNHAGNLNYIFTKLLMLSYGTENDTSYSNINQAMGVVECVKLEFYRKVAAPYEDKKEEENGPITPTVNPVVLEPVTIRHTGEHILEIVTEGSPEE